MAASLKPVILRATRGRRLGSFRLYCWIERSRIFRASALTPAMMIYKGQYM